MILRIPTKMLRKYLNSKRQEFLKTFKKEIDGLNKMNTFFEFLKYNN